MNLLKMNKTIKLLMLSDIFLVTGFGLTDPIIAIFFSENITGGSVFASGIAISLFMITKASVQLPFSRHVDKYDDNNDVKWLLIGTFIITLVPIFYIFASSMKVIYLIQVLYGIGSGLAYPAWLGLWSTHLDKKHESFEWSLYSTLSGVGAALAASIGAGLAQFAGFKVTFIFTGLLSLLGCYIILKLRNKEILKIGKHRASHGYLVYASRMFKSIPHIIILLISLAGLVMILKEAF